MALPRLTKSIAVVTTAGILSLGFGPAATAAAESTQVAITADEAAAKAALERIVNLPNIDALSAQVTGDTADALAEVRAALQSPSAQDIDLIGELKKLAKFAQPIIVAALRVGGPIVADVLDSIADLVAAIPGIDIGGPIVKAVLKPIALAIRVGAPALADLIEKIKIEGVPQAEAQRLITDHLRQDVGLSANSANALGSILAEDR
ncbi:hypothetical protein [Amycolatopsis anabasis]|uniref:hypothetical protein n=1 Tax=Amycolatopsis anabasis TaxID=1840409 RepID=UPI00131C2BDF|nr:hypothetical protein [Amycolatopsis anabasis]